MSSVKTAFLLAFIILFSSCKDIVFNNPLDPKASKGEMIIHKVLKTDFPGGGELAFDGEKIWKIFPDGRAISFDPESGEKIRDLFFPPATGITFIKDSLYLASASNYIYLFNPLSGDLIENILTGEKYFVFIAGIDEKIVGFEKKSLRFFLFEPDSGEFTELFTLTGFNIGGISIYKQKIILTEKSSASVYLFDLNGEVKGVYSAPVYDISGITTDESLYIYISSTDGKIYKVTLP